MLGSQQQLSRTVEVRIALLSHFMPMELQRLEWQIYIEFCIGKEPLAQPSAESPQLLRVDSIAFPPLFNLRSIVNTDARHVTIKKKASRRKKRQE